MSNKSLIEWAREGCNEAHAEARRLQGEAGIAPANRCRKPVVGFMQMSIEALDALTERFNAIIIEVSAALETKKATGIKTTASVVEIAPVEVKTPEVVIQKIPPPFVASAVLLEQARETAARETARKECVKAQMEAYRFQKCTDVPQEQRCKLPQGFKSLGIAEYARLTAEYEAIADELRPVIEAKIMADVAVMTEALAARDALEARYQELLREGNALAPKFGKQPRTSLDLSKMSDAQLAEVIAEMGPRLQILRALETRTEYERNQKLRTEYLALQRSGRAHQPFGVWARMQPMRRTG